MAFLQLEEFFAFALFGLAMLSAAGWLLFLALLSVVGMVTKLLPPRITVPSLVVGIMAGLLCTPVGLFYLLLAGSPSP